MAIVLFILLQKGKLTARISHMASAVVPPSSLQKSKNASK